MARKLPATPSALVCLKWPPPRKTELAGTQLNSMKKFSCVAQLNSRNFATGCRYSHNMKKRSERRKHCALAVV